jgi:hypothetical protein
VLFGCNVYGAEPLRTLLLLFDSLCSWRSLGARADVEAIAHKVIRVAKKGLVSNPPEFADVTGIVVATYRRLAKRQEALTLYLRELQVREAAGRRRPNTCCSL